MVCWQAARNIAVQQMASQKVKRNSRRKSVAPESPGQNKRMNAIVETTRDGLPGQSGCLGVSGGLPGNEALLGSRYPGNAGRPVLLREFDAPEVRAGREEFHTHACASFAGVT